MKKKKGHTTVNCSSLDLMLLLLLPLLLLRVVEAAARMDGWDDPQVSSGHAELYKRPQKRPQTRLLRPLF